MSYIEAAGKAIASAYCDNWDKLTPAMQGQYKRMGVRAAKSLLSSFGQDEEMKLTTFLNSVLVEDHLSS